MPDERKPEQDGQKRRHTMPVRHAVIAVCRKRASSRWSALLTQTKSHIAHRCGMRERLGEANWAAFVRFAEAVHKDKFIKSFAPPTGALSCEGTIDGAACRHGVCIDLRCVSSIECEEALPGLHLEHTHDLSRICRVWSAALPAEPRTWDDGIDGALLVHLLFGVEGHPQRAACGARLSGKQLVMRCGDHRGVKGQAAGDFCHDVAGAHYERVCA